MTKHQHNYIPHKKGLKCSCGHYLSISDAAIKINLLEAVIHKSEDDIDMFFGKLCKYLSRKAMGKI